jgi:CBS domain-containing protein
MDEADLRTAPVTTSEGVLVGLAYRSDVERALERSERHGRARSGGT